MSRPIVVPPMTFAVFDEFGCGADDRVQDYAHEAVEADRRGIVVADEDVEAATGAYCDVLCDGPFGDPVRAALESYAKRLRGET